MPRSTTRSRRTAAAAVAAVLLAVVLALTTTAPAPAGADAVPAVGEDGWKAPAGAVRVQSDDAIGVSLDGATPRVSERTTSGYTLFNSAMGLNSRYVVRMVNDLPWSAIDEEVGQVMAQAEYVTGVDFVWGPTASSHATTGLNEIGVSVSTMSPCGPLSNPGTIGCGVWYSIEGRVINGEVYICNCVASTTELYGTTLHEFGHVLGLDHHTPTFQGRRQVMYPSYQAGLSIYRSGDVNGLRRMVANAGRTAPYHPPSAPGTPSVSDGGGVGTVRATWAGASYYGRSVNQHQVQVQNMDTLALKTVTSGAGLAASVDVFGGDPYRARVRAHNSVGWGPWTAWGPSAYITGRCISSIADVSEYSVFCGDITWLLDEGITTGYDNGTYQPGAPVARGAMAAFLMRYAEHLVPGSTDGDWSVVNSFTDVPGSHPFHDEIEWLASTGVTSGYPDGTFAPGRAVSRSAMAAFLMRFTEELFPGSTDGDWSATPFWDVPPSHLFHDEVTWLASTGITGGFPDGGFHPGENVSRGGMAAFLHRHDADFG
jgi:hypothetical protein